MILNDVKIQLNTIEEAIEDIRQGKVLQSFVRGY